jgi:integrase
MKWVDLNLDFGVWAVPQENREKGTGGGLALAPLALEIIRAQPRHANSPYVFPATRGKGPKSGLSHGKEALDALVVAEAKIPHWVFHDLRRTAKTLMARAGVPPHVSERALGHAMEGVEGTYDHHDYRDEKGEALAKLAGLIARILDPRSNVAYFVPLCRDNDEGNWNCGGLTPA